MGRPGIPRSSLPRRKPAARRASGPRVPPIPSDDTSYLTYDETTSQFLATVKIGTEWGRSVWLSTSPDFLMWTDPKLILHSDEIDRNNRRRIRERAWLVKRESVI